MPVLHWCGYSVGARPGLPRSRAVETSGRVLLRPVPGAPSHGPVVQQLANVRLKGNGELGRDGNNPKKARTAG